jgi:phosphoribosylamine--glycine ligase
VRILIVGNGGREHALLWKLSRDAPGAELFITRGNGGTAPLARSIPLGAEEIQALAGWAEKEAIDLTVVGPEVPLAQGIVDLLSARGLPAFGPTAAAAEIESSKAFSKALMHRHGIPTAAFATFTDPGAAEVYIRANPTALVVKASGLAAGKGAVVCGSTEEAAATARAMLTDMSLGEAGREVVVEELMKGEELSVFALTDGERVIPLLPAQDHKRVGEGDTGPNTGGMGAYAPVSIATTEVRERVTREILLPTVAALAKEGRPFRGLLYAGVMLTEEGPKVVEFNCRFGDPETQVVLPLLEDSLLEPLLAIARGEGLAAWEGRGLRWRDAAAVTTVVSAPGYPGDYPKGLPVEIPTALGDDPDLLVFHAGTALREGRVVSSGGRILSVTAVAPTVAEAAARSREAAEQIQIPGAHFRRDIGWREIERVQDPAPDPRLSS